MSAQQANAIAADAGHVFSLIQEARAYIAAAGKLAGHALSANDPPRHTIRTTLECFDTALCGGDYDAFAASMGERLWLAIGRADDAAIEVQKALPLPFDLDHGAAIELLIEQARVRLHDVDTAMLSACVSGDDILPSDGLA